MILFIQLLVRNVEISCFPLKIGQHQGQVQMPTFELQSKSDFPKQAYFGSNTLIKVLPDKEKKLFHNALTKTGIQGNIFSFIWSWKILTLATSSQETCKPLEKLVIIHDSLF